MNCAGPLCYAREGGNAPCCLGLMLAEWRVGGGDQSMAECHIWWVATCSALFPRDGVVKLHP